MARCKQCKEVVKNKGNTTNLRQHLQRKHALKLDEVKKMNKNPKKGPNEEHDIPPESMDSSKESPSSSVNMGKGPGETATRTEEIKKANSQTVPIYSAFDKVRSYGVGGSRDAAITNALLYMMAQCSLPYTFVEEEGFKVFMSTVDPLYKVPGRSKITILMDEKYEVLKNKMKGELGCAENVSLTSDVWTCKFTTKSFQSLTVHHYDRNKMSMASKTIDTLELSESHTGAYLGSKMRSVCNDWNITDANIFCVVTDGAPNIVKAACDEFGDKKHLNCYAHTLNLVPQKAIGSCDDVKGLIGKVKTIVTYFKQSVKAADELRRLQKMNSQEILKLKQEVVTRWNSTYFMTERYVKLHPLVNCAMANCDDPPASTVLGELECLNDILQLLGPFEQATRAVSGQVYATASSLIPITRCLFIACEKSSPSTKVGTSLKDNLSKQLKQRFQHIEKQSILAIATVLDPRYKKIHFSDMIACSRAISQISRLIGTEPAAIGYEEPPEKKKMSHDLWAYHDELVSASQETRQEDTPGGIPVELRQYLNQAPVGRHENPFSFWEKYREVYPKLYTVAVKYLSGIGTSVPSEHLFSVAGDIASAKRSRLEGKRLSSLLFLHSLSKEDWFGH